jgi:hypothetical protein
MEADGMGEVFNPAFDLGSIRAGNHRRQRRQLFPIKYRYGIAQFTSPRWLMCLITEFIRHHNPKEKGKMLLLRRCHTLSKRTGLVPPQG